MRRHLHLTVVLLAAFAIVAIAGPALANHRKNQPGEHLKSHLLFDSATGAINSDIAFWGNKAYVGNYQGFRIFDISGTRPRLISSFPCFGPQNDPSVWDRDGDGQADILFLSVDSVMTAPECGSTAVPLGEIEEPDGWEGIRIFDVSDPRKPRQIGAVYQDCGSHTHTLVPDPNNHRVLLYNSSYTLRFGPTCGPGGAAVGHTIDHGVIQVVEVSWDPADPLGPVTAIEIAEPPINYPGDPDNVFNPAEHGLLGFNPLRACHDIGVILGATAPGSQPGDMGLAAGACAEQAQLWRIGPDGIPDTANPLWVFDDPEDVDGPGGGDVAVDFWHSATFSWDGKVVNFIDESFGDGCPTVTPIGFGVTGPNSDTGRMFFLDVATGAKLSHFFLGRATAGDPIPYCSAHMGNVVPAKDRYLLVNAWYRGGADIIDFTDPTNPKEIAFFDKVNADNWSAYWYERGPAPQGTSLTIYGNDGVHDPATGAGFEVFKVFVGPTQRVGVDHLNPQTQEFKFP